MLMFGPRWLWALPLGVAIPAAALVARKALGPLAISLVIILGPLMGFCTPWRPVINRKPPDQRIRILTCNVHYNELDAELLSKEIIHDDLDIVVLQGWTGKHKSIVFRQTNWYLQRNDEFLLASRYPVRMAEISHLPIFNEGNGAFACYDLELPSGLLHLFNIHLASPRQALQSVIDRPREAATFMEANSNLRWKQSQAIQNWIQGVDGPVILAGDFNTPPDSSIYRECWSHLHNAFSEAGFGWGHTYFTRRAAVRIDHQLGGAGWQCRRCWVGPDVGSPHHPVIADWEWTNSRD
jgi:endonuclease/exonuclease/phosphatase (EEP) superfamily protein YafD